MKRFLIAVFAMVLLMFSCKGNKTAKDADEVVPDSSDSFVVDTVPVDTMEQLISETPMPKAADELFDDFSSISQPTESCRWGASSFRCR